jgi:hypothetical protein
MNFYYEVTSQGNFVTSGFSATGDLALPVTPRMSLVARLLVYQILPGGEVAADYLLFAVEAAFPQIVTPLLTRLKSNRVRRSILT